MANQKEYSIKINGIKEGINDTSSLGDKLNSLNEGMKKGVSDVNNYTTSIKGIKKEIKAIQNEMAGLEKGSKAWTDLAKKAGELKDKVDDIRQATARFASDTKALDDVINLAKSATSVFGVLQGAMSEFGVESEEAAEAIKKLQATMTILTSLQQLQNSLKGSSATATLLTKAMNLLGIGMNGATTASKALRIALASIGIGLVITAVTVLVEHWEDLVSWLNKSFPMFEKCGGFMNTLEAAAIGLGKAVLNWIVNPFKTVASVFKHLFAGEFEAAMKAATDGIKQQFQGTVDTFNKAFKGQVNKGLEEITLKQIEEDNKRTKHNLDMLKAQKGNAAKFSKEGIELQKKDFAERRKLAKGNQDELNKIAVDEANFYREMQESKSAAAQKAAKEGAAAAKAAAREREKAEEEAKRKAEEAAREEEARRKKLYSEQAKNTQLLLEEQKLLYNEDLRNIHNEMDAQDDLISKYKDEQKQLEKIISSNNTSNKVRKQAQEEWNKLNNKIISSQKEKNRLIDEEAEIQKQLIRLEQDRKQNAVYDSLKEEIRETLKLKELSNEEFMNYINQDSEQFKSLSDDMKQTVINALQEIHNQAVQSQQEIDKVNDAANKAKKKNEEKPSTTPDKSDGEKPKWLKELNFWGDVALDLADGVGDAISAMFEMAVEEAQEALDEVSSLYDQAQAKTEESKNRLSEIEDQMSTASGARLEQLKEQQADEMAMLAERDAEEKRLEKEKEKREKELEKKKKQQRKMELKVQMVEALASGALAAINGFATKPFVPVGLAMGALATTLTGLQIAIMAKQMSKLADGGLLQGKSHSQGGIPVGNTGIEVEGGEYVVNKRSTAKYLPLLQALNEEGARHKTFANQVGKYANGGELNSQRITSNYDYLNNSKAIERTIEAIDIHPVVSVVDINQGQKDLVQVREMAGGNS
jgi:hypothetical protein